MIIKKIWKVEKLNRRCDRVEETRIYEGWFLLGFIPLYIRCSKFEY